MPIRNSQNKKLEVESNLALINLQKIIQIMENSIEKNVDSKKKGR